ncbi:MMPL family transporter [Legionella jordanis]|uniref:Membrane protein YdfJ n=1 Tax=Legionella jordanis TaxID=456 RepID=A0A0W0V7I1_9GAMM|nr:MMPL family transporter [Legionella jordanis]KTD16087.1 Membrane protein YdfJ [Legionella jordanis]RMX04681.1 MMPL family transporter [Legionella jordanis]RMX18390.1 MMPL family transporter [Legionella jordanis]VEH12453.1 Putative membrane protein ydgH [Legionella jordanis]HAT8713964.1 MMPL family transporter [Legionella jordanis]
MEKHLFYKFGNLIYPLRWYLISLWLLMLLACLPFLPHIISPFKSTGFIDEHSESAKTQELINHNLNYNNENKFIIMFHSDTLKASNPLFIKKIKWSLSPLKNFPIENKIIFPSENKKQISKDKHTAYAVVIVKSPISLNSQLLDQFTNSIRKPTNMTVEMGGQPLFMKAVNKQTQVDLYRADFFATPVAIITMLFVFGSLIAAFLPVFLGGGCALIILCSLYFLGQVWTLSIYTLNIALLLGLCLSLDYSLFIINRFREELENGLSVREAIAVTVETAGKAIFFSGLAVLVSLSALFLFPINILFSMAMGGMSAVLVAVFTAVIVLPAILAVLKSRINLFSIHFSRKHEVRHSRVWHWLAEKVVGHPLLFLFPILILLLALGYPFLSAKFGVSDYKILPKDSESRAFFNSYSQSFNIKELSAIQILVQTKGDVLSRKNLSRLYDLVQQLKKYPGVDQIRGIVSSDADLNKNQYYKLYSAPKKMLSGAVKILLDTTTGHSFTVMTVISKYAPESEKNSDLVESLRNLNMPGLKLSYAGTPVSNYDVLKRISESLPLALIWIMVFTYLILLLLLRSLFLPVKAILMNLISLSACYGALVLVFQEGYLSHYLHFEPQGSLDISLLVIIFCALFGFSMDYEVFLLSRIKEAHETTQDTNKAIVFGIERSSRIITSAALIVIVICGSFLVADVLMVKAFGLGIAVAIFVDAFLIRTLLVPSTMAILQSLNWYLPRWMDKILPKL